MQKDITIVYKGEKRLVFSTPPTAMRANILPFHTMHTWCWWRRQAMDSVPRRCRDSLLRWLVANHCQPITWSTTVPVQLWTV